MEFNETQVDELKKLFDQNDVDRDGKLNESELRKLLLDFEIDESFAPAMLRILIRKDADSGNPAASGHHEANVGAKFEDIMNFFQVLLSGDLREFFKQLFAAIDMNGDGELGMEDLQAFARMVNDNLTDQDAQQIIEQCDVNRNGKVKFDDFWKWYKDLHGLTEETDRQECSTGASPEDV